MNHTIASLELYSSRRKRLELRLEQIANAMFGRSLRVSDVLAKCEGNDLGQRLHNAAERLVRYVDELQGAFFLYGHCDDAVNACLNMDASEVAQQSASHYELSDEWKAIVGDSASYGALEEVVSHELHDLPTTFTQNQHELLHTFFFCALGVSVCPAFVSGEAALDGMFGGIQMGTVEFLRSTLGSSVRIGQKSGMRLARADAHGVTLSDYLVPDGHLSDDVAMTHEELVLRELSADELVQGHALEKDLADFFDYRFWENAGSYDLFSYLDAMCAAYTGKNPCSLSDSRVVHEVVNMPQVRSFAKDYVEVDAVVDGIYQKAFLRPLTTVDAADWSGMEDSQRYAAALEGLDECDEAELRDVIDKDGFHMMMDEALGALGFTMSPEEWKQLSHPERVEMLRTSLEALLDEMREMEALYEDYPNDADKIICEARDVFRRDVCAWLDQTGLADELFDQYKRLRTLYFDVKMPQGANPSYFMDSSYQLFANGARELVLEALEMLLGDAGLSRTMDDELYMRTFGELDDIKYFIDTTLLNRLRDVKEG